MSQYSLLGIMPDSDGATFRAGMNSAIQAILSGNAGPVEPPSAVLVSFFPWWDTANGIVKRRNESNTAWIDEAYFDGSSITPIGSSGYNTGDVLLTIEASQPSGWLFCDGKTMGSSSSGAVYASTSYEALFSFVWANLSNTWAPIYNSGGSPVSRGANAAADWASNYRLALPDYRGGALVVKDNLGGSSANRITDANADALGGRGGAETVTLTVDQIPAHNHRLRTYARAIDGSGSEGDRTVLTSQGYVDGYIESTGGGSSHNNVMPFSTINIKIKI